MGSDNARTFLQATTDDFHLLPHADFIKLKLNGEVQVEVQDSLKIFSNCLQFLQWATVCLLVFEMRKHLSKICSSVVSSARNSLLAAHSHPDIYVL